MTLPATLDAIEDAPTDAARYYVRCGSRFVLDVRQVDGTGLGDIAKLTHALLEAKLRSAIEKAGAPADLVLPIALQRARLNPTSLKVEALKEDGSPALVVVGGNDVMPGGANELIADLARDQRYSPAFAKDEKEATTDERQLAAQTSNLTEQMRSILAQRSAEPAGRAALVEALRGPNPWRKDAVNLTKQMLITRFAPDRAAALKAEVG